MGNKKRKPNNIYDFIASAVGLVSSLFHNESVNSANCLVVNQNYGSIRRIDFVEDSKFSTFKDVTKHIFDVSYNNYDEFRNRQNIF